MASVYSTMLAAGAWTQPTTRKKVMDVELAEAFANILDIEINARNGYLAEQASIRCQRNMLLSNTAAAQEQLSAALNYHEPKRDLLGLCEQIRKKLQEYESRIHHLRGAIADSSRCDGTVENCQSPATTLCPCRNQFDVHF